LPKGNRIQDLESFPYGGDTAFEKSEIKLIPNKEIEELKMPEIHFRPNSAILSPKEN
jgi:hypothetical protein